MKLDQFLRTVKERQLEILFRDGVIIGRRTAGAERILLCQLHGFYAEIVYHPKENGVNEVRAFDQLLYLEPYLEAMDISDLLPERPGGAKA